MIMLVLDDVNHLDDVLAAWARAGAIGVTAIESTGAHQRRSALGLVHARRNVENLGIEIERANFTLFGIVGDAAHCQIDNLDLFNRVIFDWLAEVWQADREKSVC